MHAPLPTVNSTLNHPLVARALIRDVLAGRLKSHDRGQPQVDFNGGYFL